ncbi:Zinc transporter zip3 [Plakobranchus ocellatus]|uniref:Zinc transporter zip3 n=1 Tax=Plakobranchus ocellatus TaxID=259542 RepID=A0AAV3Y2Q4_9GAST|nr:Zinc transporter zip3 [Plakobranchus ocellatus]
MKQYQSKILTAVVLFILTMVFSLIPYFMLLRGSRSIISSRLRDRVIALMNCLAGGAFLGTFLLHILAEGSEEFEEYKEKAGWSTEFPLFNLFVAVGFFLVSFVELIAHIQFQRNRGKNVNSCNSSTVTGPTMLNERFNDHISTDRSQLQGAISVISDPVQREPSLVCHNVNEIKPYEETDGRHLEKHHHLPKGVQALLLLFALSFHTIFDGLAVGLQTSESEVWSVFAAIAIHKSIIAFCLGLELFQTNPEKPWRAILWLLFFALMSPLGIVIGIELTTGHMNETAKLLASSILQGLAGGTFLYVTFLEILCQYLGHYSSGNFLNQFFIFFGFAIMAGAKLLDHD